MMLGAPPSPDVGWVVLCVVEGDVAAAGSGGPSISLPVNNELPWFMMSLVDGLLMISLLPLYEALFQTSAGAPWLTMSVPLMLVPLTIGRIKEPHQACSGG